jgi:predicted RNA-binding Zn-ribbon protein involved in translation (DUF1610 family)
MTDDGPVRDCPKCGQQMKLARITPKIGPHPNLLSFKCDNCGEVVTTIDDGDRQDDLN